MSTFNKKLREDHYSKVIADNEKRYKEMVGDVRKIKDWAINKKIVSDD